MIDPQDVWAAAGKTLPIPGPEPKYEHIGESGRTVLWIVFIIMLLSSGAFAAMSWTVPLPKRMYHTITTLITITAAISYFAMATNTGITYHQVKPLKNTHVPHTDGSKHGHEHPDVFRQIFWARYVDWAITTPLLLLDLGLLAGMSGGHIIMAIVADLIMILTGLFSAFPESKGQKWGFYAIACFAFIIIIWHLAINGRKSAQAHGTVGKLFGGLALYTLVIWTAYPIIWGIADGGRVVGVNAEVIAYAIVDVLAKPVFGFWLLFAHKNTQDAGLEVGGFWAHGFAREGAVRLEDDDGA